MKSKKFLLLILLAAALLRFWGLDRVPVSLFGDELDVGYHAYSILKTGKDYSGNSWPLHFQSLAEWRTPLYLYSVVPSVAVWGISPLGVRVPAAIFGVLGVLVFYLLVRELFQKENLALLSAFVLTVSPWHIQYSRAGFEVTQLLLFLLLGLYFFFRSLKDGKWLWVSVAFLTLTPWVYSTAKLFTPLLMLFLFVVWRKKIMRLARADLIKGVIAGLVIGLPIAYSTLFGGGSQRFNYISVFSDPTTVPEVGFARQNDARMRGELGEGLEPNLVDRILHNKFVFWGKNISDNYLQAFSTDFLFVGGDINLRHSIEDVGQFYKIEFAALILGLILFFASKTQNRKVKALIAFWIFAGVIPSAITRNGGTHATRLILILPPLVFLISYGLYKTVRMLGKKNRYLFITAYSVFFVLGFVFYQHNLWVHNPWYSQRWWHYGWGESIDAIKSVEKDYDRVFISMSGEPAWIFFAGHYEYPPQKWHDGYPMSTVSVEGFGDISYIDKYYFAAPEDGIYSLGEHISSKDLYLANAGEVGENLIVNPDKTPAGLKLLSAVAYPSGEPVFYLFTRKD